MDYEFQEQWVLELYNFSQFTRRKPVRLRDREALKALLTAFEHHAGVEGYSVSINEVDIPHTSADDLLDLAPPRIAILHLQARKSSLVVRLTSWQGGQTWVWASLPDGRPDQEALRRLAGLVESTSKPLGLRRHLSKSKYAKVRALSPSVVDRTRRDELSARRVTWRATWVSAGVGFVGGLLGALASGGG